MTASRFRSFEICGKLRIWEHDRFFFGQRAGGVARETARPGRCQDLKVNTLRTMTTFSIN